MPLTRRLAATVAVGAALIVASAIGAAAQPIPVAATRPAQAAPAPGTKPQAAVPAPGAPGSVTQRTPLPSAKSPSRGARRAFARCNREAKTRRLRGAQRRSFVARCRLGFTIRGGVAPALGPR